MLSSPTQQKLSRILKMRILNTFQNTFNEYVMTMVRWLKFQGTETPSLQEQLIFV